MYLFYMSDVVVQAIAPYQIVVPAALPKQHTNILEYVGMLFIDWIFS